MRRSILSTLALALLALTGCTVKGSLYPVQGPLSQGTPTVLPGKFTVHSTKALKVSITMKSGEVVSGTLPRTFPVQKGLALSTLPAPMTDQWDQIYGKGSYTATVLGQGQDVRG